MTLACIFVLVGIGFGAAFVFINAGGLPEPWSWIVRALGVALVAVAVWSSVVRPRPPSVAMTVHSARAYWMAVGVEVLAIPLGAFVINKVLHRPELAVLWVVFVVGAHFLPARAFGVGRWTQLGLVLIALALLRGVGTYALGASSAPAAAVLAGAVLLIFVAIPGLAFDETGGAH